MCPSCGSSDIENNESSGDTVCINCGVVIEESNIVSAVEFAEVSGTWSAGFLAGAHSSHCRALGDQPPLLGNMWPRQRRSLSRPRCLCMDSRRSRVRYAGNRVACASGLSRVVCVRVRTCACVCACVRACAGSRWTRHPAVRRTAQVQRRQCRVYTHRGRERPRARGLDRTPREEQLSQNCAVVGENARNGRGALDEHRVPCGGGARFEHSVVAARQRRRARRASTHRRGSRGRATGSRRCRQRGQLPQLYRSNTLHTHAERGSGALHKHAHT